MNYKSRRVANRKQTAMPKTLEAIVDLIEHLATLFVHIKLVVNQC